MKEYKLTIYDRFQCSAGACELTCCKGWDIAVDSQTYQKWKFDTSRKLQLAKNVTVKKDEEAVAYKINMGKQKQCPFLDENGLCKVYREYSEEFLSDTCNVFPRWVSEYEERREYALSLACPVTLELLQKEPRLIKMEERTSAEENTNTFVLRDRLVEIIEDMELPLLARLYLAYELLYRGDQIINDPKQEEQEWEDILELQELQEILEEYNSHEKRQEWYDIDWNQSGDEDLLEKYRELSELFTDVTLLYREEAFYRPYLEPVLAGMEVFSQEEKVELMKDFRQSLERKETQIFLTNVLLAGIYHDCVGDVLEYEMVLIAFLLSEFAVLVAEKATKGWQNVSIFYTIFSRWTNLFARIISHNAGSVGDFLEESYGDPIWPLEYVHLLLK